MRLAVLGTISVLKVGVIFVFPPMRLVLKLRRFNPYSKPKLRHFTPN